jgi:3-oxoacid CoA-transferase subunit B
MIRGGHVDVAVLGGMQVAANGDLANWMVPGSMVKGMGGAMDLVSGAGRVIVLMDHVSKSGAAKLVVDCDLPLTGKAAVSRVIINMGVFDVTGVGFDVVELADGVDFDEVVAKTAAPLRSRVSCPWGSSVPRANITSTEGQLVGAACAAPEPAKAAVRAAATAGAPEMP